jgi:hypothetical protein
MTTTVPIVIGAMLLAVALFAHKMKDKYFYSDVFLYRLLWVLQYLALGGLIVLAVLEFFLTHTIKEMM